MKRLIIYSNGYRVVWNGRAEIHYHQVKIIKEHDLTHATSEEIAHLKINPHNDLLLAEITKRSIK